MSWISRIAACDLRPAHEAARPPAPLDQPGRGEFRHRLVHGHARAAIFGGKLVLERDAVAGRPFARQDAAADVGEDALVERRLAIWPPLPRPSCSSSSAVELASSPSGTAWQWRRAAHAGHPRPASCRAPRRSRPLAPSAKIQASRMASPSCRRAPGASASSDTKSAAAPCRQPAGAGAERRRAAGERGVEQARARSSRGAGQHVAGAVREPLRVFELAQLVGDADQHIGIGADAEAAARSR